jgi:pimeloyl-ACP methyl ester carboxylesterase
MQVLLHNGVSVHTKVIGEGKPILCVHGMGHDHRSMTGWLEPVFQQRKGWKRIYLDLPGMGRTKATDQLKSTDDMLEVLLGLIDKIIPGERFAIAGFSYGAYLSRGVVHRRYHDINGIALFCQPVLAYERTLPQRKVIETDPDLLSRLPAEEADLFARQAVVQTELVWKRFKEDLLPAREWCDPVFLPKLRAEHYEFSFPVDELPAPLQRPALILAGHQDHIAGYKDIWDILENYPRATFAVLDRAGHLLPIEQEQLFHSMVAEWLDRVEQEWSES